MAEERYEAAIVVLLRVVDEAPDVSESHAALAEAYRSARLRRDELASRRKALMLARTDEERAEALNQLADPLAFFGAVSEAIACLREAVTLVPEQKVYWMNLAAFLIREHDAGSGLEALEKAKALSGDSAVYFMWLGRARRLVGDCEGSIRAFERSAEINPEAQHVWRDLGMAYVDAGRFEEAEHVCRTKLREGLACHLILAKVKCLSGQPTDACMLTREALNAMPGPGAFAEVRWHYCNRRSHEELIEYVKGISRGLAGCPWPHWILARLYAVADRPREAAGELRELISRDDRLGRSVNEDEYFRGAEARNERLWLQFTRPEAKKGTE